MDKSCLICDSSTEARDITIRGGKIKSIWHCSKCNFDFFGNDPTAGLVDNKLDQTRLQAAGLDIPKVDEDFLNGLNQSASLIEEYLGNPDKGRNILEIGCSWGYFLQAAKEIGVNPYGVELNLQRAKYVNDTLAIPCDESLEKCEQRGLRFKKIFLFYVLEYVPDLVSYTRRLIDLLDVDGELIIITPNLIDPLKNIWRNNAFEKFFYDEHAVNYFSPEAINKLMARAQPGNTLVSTRQGYSFANHLSWHLTGSPRTTGVVGGDNYIRDLIVRLRDFPKGALSPCDENRASIVKSLASLIEQFDCSYKKCIEDHGYGNQIRVVYGKNNIHQK